MVSWWTYNRSHEQFWEDYDLARHARDMEFNEWLLKCIQRGRQELIPQVYFISPYFKYELPPLSQEVLEARIGDSMKPGDPPRQESTIDIHPFDIIILLEKNLDWEKQITQHLSINQLLIL